MNKNFKTGARCAAVCAAVILLWLGLLNSIQASFVNSFASAQMQIGFVSGMYADVLAGFGWARLIGVAGIVISFWLIYKIQREK